MTNSNPTIAYFGYGSLVNLNSLRTPYISAHRATLKGWQRIWLSRPEEAGSFASIADLAFLSVTPSLENEIDGMLITDHLSSLPALDERESLYSRVELNAEHLYLHDDTMNTTEEFLYVADKHPANHNARILRSYLDVVMQGYLHHYGMEGLSRFFTTTQNFDLEIHEDRDRPLYPRATRLTSEEKSIFANFR